MTSIAIVYHSGFGHTQKQAESVLLGVNSAKGVSGRLLQAEYVTDHLEELSGDQGIIFGSPTYMGSASAPFKAFMDATSKLWMQMAWKDKVAAGFTNSYSLSGDKLSTLLQLTVFAMQHGMIWVGQSEQNKSPANQAGDPQAINRVGGFMGAMAQSDDAPPDVTPPTGDLLTAQHFGKRVALIASRLHG
jgi:NAD(P)H dehydrogenase (quinone)